MRDRPARCAPDNAQPGLPVQPVDLVDHAVDIEGQVGTLRLDGAIDGECGRRIGHAGKGVGDGKAPATPCLDHVELRLDRHLARLAPAMRQEAQGATGGNRGVLLAERTGGGVARVGELARLLVRVGGFLRQPGVERGEIGLAHIDLAAHLEHVRRVGGQGLGNVGDGADILGHVLADRTVAAGQRLHEPPIDIA